MLTTGSGAPHRATASRTRFWVITLAAVVSLAGTAALGRWQLSRAAQKEALQTEIDARKRLPPIGQKEFLTMDKATDALHRPLTLHGLWLTSQTIYLDNRQMNGVPGFYVLTPLAIEGSQQTVMVQRGWIQRNFNERTQLQPVETPAGLVEVSGLVALPPSHLFALGQDAPRPAASAPAIPAENLPLGLPASVATGGGVGSSAIRQNLDLDAFRAETGLPLRTDVSLQQTGSNSEGLQRNWPAPALGIEKHYGYAFQWFGLSALVLFLYVWFQLIAPRRKASRAAV